MVEYTRSDTRIGTIEDQIGVNVDNGGFLACISLLSSAQLETQYHHYWRLIENLLPHLMDSVMVARNTDVRDQCLRFLV